MQVRLPGRGQTRVYDTDDGLGRVRPGAGGKVRVHQRPTLLLLHGWTSTTALNWFDCFEPLAGEFRVLALDQRGHGGGIRSCHPFRLEDCADDAAALLDWLGTGPVIAVGYSMGGAVAQLLWRRHPQLVAGLELCATAARFATRPQLRGTMGTLGYGLALALSGIPARARRQGFGLVLRRRTAARGFAPWVIGEWESNDPAALAQAGFALGRFDATDWIADIDVPTSVVVTTLDMTVSPRRQWLLQQSIPGAAGFPVAGDHRACASEASGFKSTLVAACQAVLPEGVPTPG
jgi:3-oxoadipate enol-lactonase